jgi:outer membrane lipoprotein-sorting protein
MLLAGLGVTLLAPAMARAAVRAATLTKQDYEDVLRVQTYLNGIHTLKSRFDQVAGNGGVASGTIYLERPNHMRIVYDEPVPILIVATGGEIYYYDRQLDQLSQVDVDETPAWFLLRDNIRLGGDVTITQFSRDPGVLHISMVETKRPDQGRVTMTLSERPLELRQWTVVDAQGKTVTVTLDNPTYGAKLDPNLFYWTDPRSYINRQRGN